MTKLRAVAACVLAACAAPALAQAPVTSSPATAPRAAGDVVASPDAKGLAKAHFDEGRAHYDLGRFAEALVSFEKAYEALPLPALLFNIGQCHFQEKRYARAVFFYERYLELVPDAPNRSTVEGLIEESKELDAATASSAAAAASAPARPIDDDRGYWLAAAGVGGAVAVAAGIATWVLWTSPPPAGSLGLIDRRTP